MDDHEKSAAASLDRIRKGGANLLLVCKTSLSDLGNAIDEGRFIDAYRTAATLTAKVEALCDAEAALGSLAASSLVKVRDVEVGMSVQGFGEVTEIGPCAACGGERCEGRVLHFEAGAAALPAEQEIVVLREE